VTEDQQLLELLSKKLHAESAARGAWEARGPKDQWLVLLDNLKRAELELKEVLDTIALHY
jgi:hypothetical protein